MKSHDNETDEIRAEYDPALLRAGVRGKYYQRAMAGTNIVVIDPEVAEVFSTDEAVNAALRGLIKARGKRSRKTKPRLGGSAAKPRQARRR